MDEDYKKFKKINWMVIGIFGIIFGVYGILSPLIYWYEYPGLTYIQLFMKTWKIYISSIALLLFGYYSIKNRNSN